MNWLEREVHPLGPHLILCLSQSEFSEVLAHLKADPSPWLNPNASATTHHYTNTDGRSACIVCVGSVDGRTAPQINALLVHEAVHVWQEHRRVIGEHAPSSEMEAYGIQYIAETLMTEYARRQQDVPAAD